MTSTGDFIFNKSQKYFNNTDNDKNSYSYCKQLPIVNSIDNISIKLLTKFIKEKKTNTDNKFNYIGKIQIQTYKTYQICEYHSKKLILFEYEKKLNKYSPKIINCFLSEFKDILSKLKFNKLFGEFTIEDLKLITKKNLGMDIFDLTYSNCQDCVVCYDKTFTKTSCLHHVCLDCWSKIRNNECPICRNNLILYSGSNRHIHSSDSESEEYSNHDNNSQSTWFDSDEENENNDNDNDNDNNHENNHENEDS